VKKNKQVTSHCLVREPIPDNKVLCTDADDVNQSLSASDEALVQAPGDLGAMILVTQGCVKNSKKSNKSPTKGLVQVKKTTFPSAAYKAGGDGRLHRTKRSTGDGNQQEERNFYLTYKTCHAENRFAILPEFWS
jgi:hypothetical protein